MRQTRWVAATAGALGIALSLGACASGGQSGSPGERESVVTSVTFYPACGNETLTLDGVTWYSFEPDNPEDFQTPVALGDPDSWAGMGMSRSMRAVAAPGPGDDTGTLVTYEGGYAYFVSDSGELSTWLTTDKIDYNFVC
jgi:hypothetical protein